MVDPTPAGPGTPSPSRSSRVERWFDRIDSVPDTERTPALTTFIARSEPFVNLIVLFTIWLSVIPLTAAIENWNVPLLVARLVLSLIFLVDLVVRAALSARPWAYVRDHPFLVLAVAFPPVRILLSLRLLRRTFQRGNLGRFLTVAVILLVNAAVVCWVYEQDAPGATITSFWAALWWAVVTVSTVGYGDVTPITVGGRITAFAVMVLGILTLAVVTATIASRFQDQAAQASRGDERPADPVTPAGSGLDPATVRRLLAVRDEIDALLGPARTRDPAPPGVPATPPRD